MRKFVAGVALATAVAAGSMLSLSAPAGASTVFSGPGAPNQNWTGSLGLDFIVNSPITIDALGAYSGVGANADITVGIYTDAGVLVSSLAIIATTSSPYTFESVAPITLGPGTYQVTAWGYGPIGDFNTGINQPNPPLGFNTLGGALTEGNPFYNDPGVTGFATILDDFNGGGLHFYGAGNFEAIANTPLPSTWLMLIAGFAGFGFLAYRGTNKRAAALATA